MSYRRKGAKFGREKSQRNSLTRSLMRSLILHEKIKTTEARAKAIRPMIERIITKAASDDLSTKRLLLSRFSNDERIVKKLTSDIAKRYKERKGGYVRITKLPSSGGTGRSCAVIEFV